MNYPIKMINNGTGVIVEFTSEHEGTYIKAGPGAELFEGYWDVGTTHDDFTSCKNTKLWSMYKEPIDEIVFEVGKKYICRNGEIVTIVEIDSLITTEPRGRYDSGDEDNSDKECDYYLNGRISARGEQQWDIISEYIEHKSKDTLASNEVRGNGGTTSYYDLPIGATDLGHLIKHKKMEHGIGEAFSALYRLNNNGEYRRNLVKVIYYIQKELEYFDNQNKEKCHQE